MVQLHMQNQAKNKLVLKKMEKENKILLTNLSSIHDILLLFENNFIRP